MAVAVTIIVIIVTDEPRVRLFADGASGDQSHLQGRMCDSEAGHAAQVIAADVHTQLSQIPTPHKPPSNYSGGPFYHPQLTLDPQVSLLKAL